MDLVKIAAIALSLAGVCLATMAIWIVKIENLEQDHLIFFYLLPSTCVAFLFGSMAAIAFSILSTLFAAYFLYEPIYSFYVNSPRDFGELLFFVVLSVIGTKCVAELKRPVAKPQNQKSSIRTG
jgi:K+-sensing histidine kinase KdpD